MILYIENPKDSTKKLLETINTVKLQDTKPTAFLFTNNKISEKEIKRKNNCNSNQKNKTPRKKLSKGYEGPIY